MEALSTLPDNTIILGEIYYPNEDTNAAGIAYLGFLKLDNTNE